jgi:hypothetical protein
MSLLRTLTLLGLTASTYANPLPSLTPRDNGACYPQNMPIGQADYNCPKKTTLDSSGHCSKPIPNVPGSAGCTAYCEIRVTAEYGQEVPIMDGSCQSGTTCSVSEGQSVTITNGYSINLGITGGAGSDLSKTLTASFNIGASYSWSKSVGYTTTETFSKTLDDKTCGYWTFIPYLITYVFRSLYSLQFPLSHPTSIFSFPLFLPPFPYSSTIPILLHHPPLPFH